MRKILLLLLPIAALGFAPAPVYREKPSDPDAVLRRLQGGWRGVSYRQANDFVFRVQVEKDRWRFFVGSPPTQATAFTITLDTKTNPMRIDWRRDRVHLKGIFVLSGERLIYIWRDSTQGYPQSLTAPAPEDCVVEVQREK